MSELKKGLVASAMAVSVGDAHADAPIGDLTKTCITETLYSIMGPLVREDRNVAEHFMGDQIFAQRNFERLQRLQDEGRLPPAVSLPTKVEELYGPENDNNPQPGS
jgi:hypothetical protein